MKDILKFGQYVRQIAEAHSTNDSKREKALAQKAEEWFDIYGVPDYSAMTGEAVEEPSFVEDVAAAERTGKNGKKILCVNLQDAHSIKEQAEKYLTATEGEKAPGRCYMRRCLNAVEGVIEYLENLGQMPRFALTSEYGKVISSDSYQVIEGTVTSEGSDKPEEIVMLELPPREEIREPLFRQVGFKTNIPFVSFKDYINRLTQNGILRRMKGDSVRKMQAMFKSFLIGADDDAIKEYMANDDCLTIGKTPLFLVFIDKLVHKIKVDAQKNNFWDITQNWFVYKNGRNPDASSLKANCSRARKKQLISDDKNIDSLVDDLLKILYK